MVSRLFVRPVFTWAIPVVLDTILNEDKQVRHNYSMHYLFTRCSLEATTDYVFRLSSLGHHSLSRKLYNILYDTICEIILLLLFNKIYRQIRDLVEK